MEDYVFVSFYYPGQSKFQDSMRYFQCYSKEIYTTSLLEAYSVLKTNLFSQLS